jgi:hypothetical protein
VLVLLFVGLLALMVANTPTLRNQVFSLRALLLAGAALLLGLGGQGRRQMVARTAAVRPYRRAQRVLWIIGTFVLTPAAVGLIVWIASGGALTHEMLIARLMLFTGAALLLWLMVVSSAMGLI